MRKKLFKSNGFQEHKHNLPTKIAAARLIKNIFVSKIATASKKYLGPNFLRHIPQDQPQICQTRPHFPF